MITIITEGMHKKKDVNVILKTKHGNEEIVLSFMMGSNLRCYQLKIDCQRNLICKPHVIAKQ